MRDPDLRDEGLADLLDRAVSGVHPQDRAGPVVRRGRRRRAVQAVAALTTTATFVAVVAWAGSIAEQDAPESPRRNTTGTDERFAEPEAPWSFVYPADWTTRTYEQAGRDLIVNSLITTVVNGPIPGGGPFRPDDTGLPEVLGDAGAVVSIERFWSHATGSVGAGESGRSFGPGAFSPDRSNAGWSWVERARCEGTLCWHAIEWLGPNVSNEDRAAARRIADSVGLARVARWTEADDVRTTLHDEEHGYTVTYPHDTWRVADENLTPWLSEPEEVMSIGTFDMPVSDDPDDELRIFDAPVAPAALAAMDPTDAFVSLQESGVVEGARDDRPERFADGQESRIPENVAVFDAYWIPFVDAGRGLYLFVAIGHDASPQTVDEAWAVADSLRFLAPPRS